MSDDFEPLDLYAIFKRADDFRALSDMWVVIAISAACSDEKQAKMATETMARLFCEERHE